MTPSVRPERTGWRDEALSTRHRKWGFHCPAVDLDFLLNEYDEGHTVAIIEYKHECAQVQWSSHPSYRALVGLGNAAGVPVFAARYAGDFSWFKVTPLNAAAKEYVHGPAKFTEIEYIELLYRIRGRDVPPEINSALEI